MPSQIDQQQQQQAITTSTKGHLSTDSMDSSYCSNNTFDYKTQVTNDLLADNIPLQVKPKSAG